MLELSSFWIDSTIVLSWITNDANKPDTCLNVYIISKCISINGCLICADMQMLRLITIND